MIPKKIHYCWFGGAPLPDFALKCINSWRKFCPDYEIIEWNESNYDITKNDYMKEAYQVKKWGFVSDYARLDIVYTYGGIYLDTDVEIIQNLDPLLETKCFMGFESTGAVNNGLGFGAEKGCRIIADIRDSVYNGRHFINEAGALDMTPNPRLVTDYLIQHGLKTDGRMQIIDGIVTIYSTEYFGAKDFMSGEINITDKTFSIHHYDASWLEPERKKALEWRWKMKKYGKTGVLIYTIISKLYGLRLHIRQQGIVGTMRYIVTKIK